MDNMTIVASDEFEDLWESEEIEPNGGAGLDDFDDLDDLNLDDDDSDGSEESDEVYGMMSELLTRGYIINDDMTYYTIKALYDRLYFAENTVYNDEFLQKCNELYEVFKDALLGRASYVRDTHAKRTQSYSVFVDSRDTEYNVIDQSVRSNLLNKMLTLSFDEIASIDVNKEVEEEYQFLLEHHSDLSVMTSDVGRLRKHINRTVTDAINYNLSTITGFSDTEIVDSSCIIKYVCPEHADEIIRQVFVEDNRYYFIDSANKHVVIDEPVIHLLSCIGDIKPVVCWIPCVFMSDGKSYMFSAEDYMTFLRTSQGLFKDRSSSKSDVIDLGISINMFTQINDYILFNAPEELVAEKEYEFEKYSLYVSDAEIRDACKKLRAFERQAPEAFDLRDIARTFCARTNTNYQTRAFQAMVGLLNFIETNVYLREGLNLAGIMQCNCDLKFLEAFSGCSASTDKIIRDMYRKYCNSECGDIDQALVDELIASITAELTANERRRAGILQWMRSNALKLRYIEISRYDNCSMDVFARYLREDCYSIYSTIANGIVISSIAADFLPGYSFQGKSYIANNISKSNKPDGLKNVMGNIMHKLQLSLNCDQQESMDCMFTPCAVSIIKAMFYNQYAGVPDLVQELLDSVDSVLYEDELQLLRDSIADMCAASSFEELPVKVVMSLIAVAAYVQAHSEDDYQEKITVNTFTDYALRLPTDKVTTWLGIKLESNENTDLDIAAFHDFQQMRYAKELTEGTIGISKHLVDLISASKYETLNPALAVEALSAKYYKDGIKFLLEANTRSAGSVLSASSTDAEKFEYARDKSIADAIQDDGGDQAIETWLHKYLRYLGD